MERGGSCICKFIKLFCYELVVYLRITQLLSNFQAIDPCYGVTCGANSVCQSGTCQCLPGYYTSGTACVREFTYYPISVSLSAYLTYYCISGDQCSGVKCGPFASCQNGICVCNSGYVPSSGRCIRRFFAFFLVNLVH